MVSLSLGSAALVWLLWWSLRQKWMLHMIVMSSSPNSCWQPSTAGDFYTVAYVCVTPLSCCDTRPQASLAKTCGLPTNVGHFPTDTAYPPPDIPSPGQLPSTPGNFPGCYSENLKTATNRYRFKVVKFRGNKYWSYVSAVIRNNININKLR